MLKKQQPFYARYAERSESYSGRKKKKNGVHG